MILLAIDPGAHSGFAVFYRGELAETWVTSPDTRLAKFAMPDLVVIENPQIYPHSRARPADILKLARIVGRYEERFMSCTKKLVAPREWKGTIDGDIMCKRIEAGLTPQERALYGKITGYAHNALDAIGLGKWALRQPWARAQRSEGPTVHST